jgi:5-methylcytosine-specific restriction endonuclease McrA
MVGRSSSPSLHSSVLALNRHFAALQVISARRAFCLLCKGYAEVINVENGAFLTYDFEGWLSISELRAELGEITEHDDWVQSVNFRIQVPRIVRLTDYDRLPRPSVKFNRRNVFLRDEHRCQYCRQRFSTHKLSLDHVVPRSYGGPTTWENVVTACMRCNVRKGGRTPQEAGMPLAKDPVRPHRNPLLELQVNSEKYRCWSTFIG